MKVAEICHIFTLFNLKQTGFNEAAIWKSRKFRNYSVAAWAVRASMRPRYGSRGNLEAVIEVVPDELLLQ